MVRGSTVWVAELGSDGSPRRGRQVKKGRSRCTAWRVIRQAIPVAISSERAMNRVLLSKGLERMTCAPVCAKWCPPPGLRDG